jgi:hypothetical protein
MWSGPFVRIDVNDWIGLEVCRAPELGEMKLNV